MSLSTLSIDQVIDVWSELEAAYRGENGYGGDTAEIYVYRLMPRAPGSPDPQAYLDANQALLHLLRRFEDLHPDAEITLYATRSDDGRPLGPWMGGCDEPHRHHIRILRSQSKGGS